MKRPQLQGIPRYVLKQAKTKGNIPRLALDLRKIMSMVSSSTQRGALDSVLVSPRVSSSGSKARGKSRALERHRVSAKKALQESEEVTRELLGGTEEKSISAKGSLI